MKGISAPEVDMLVVSQSSRNQRKTLTNFVPKIGLSIADYSRLNEIDNFYLDCQNFRDYYRDAYNKLQRPKAFKRHFGKCGRRFLDKRSEVLLHPVSWVREKQPIVYPLNHRKDFVVGAEIFLGGQHYSGACNKYKR